jgi:hypothetical protein
MHPYGEIMGYYKNMRQDVWVLRRERKPKSLEYEETVIIISFLPFLFGTAAQRGLWPPRPRGFLITHNDAP